MIGDDDSLASRVTKYKDPNEKQKQQQLQENLKKQQELARKELEEILTHNATRPINISKINIIGGNKTRSSFLQTQISPIINKQHTVSSLISTIDEVTANLVSFNIFKNVQYTLDVAPKDFFSDLMNPLSSLNNNNNNESDTLNLITSLHVLPSKQFFMETGTSVGNGEGNGYTKLAIKNIFGGGENLTLDATIGTRTKSSYLINFNQPINNSAHWKNEVLGFITSRDIPWSSHHEKLVGLSTNFKHINTNLNLNLNNMNLNSKERITRNGLPKPIIKHSFGFETVWRTIYNLKPFSSESILKSAGDNFKTSLIHNFEIDSRNNLLLPTKGLNLKLNTEISGILPIFNFLKSHENFIKSTFEISKSKSLKNDDFIFHFNSRFGFLMNFLNNKKEKRESHPMDRFFIGGPNDVRGFYLNGLGPKDLNDSLGGDFFLSNGLSLFTRLPNLKKDSNLRFHSFINSGSLINNLLNSNGENDFRKLKKLLLEPSISAGFGIVYRHPAVRLELNLTMPLIARHDDFVRKGIQFGIGMSFL